MTLSVQLGKRRPGPPDVLDDGGLRVLFMAYSSEGVEPVLDFEREGNPAILLNNREWLGKLSLIEFLRDVGKAFPISVMLSRESVRRRLESESGLSFTEFSYQVLQSYDFHHLYENYGCRLQVGGSDQMGNILAGVDYIRRVTGRDHGAGALIFPLVTDSSGEKFGKTAKRKP